MNRADTNPADMNRSKKSVRPTFGLGVLVGALALVGAQAGQDASMTAAVLGVGAGLVVGVSSVGR